MCAGSEYGFEGDEEWVIHNILRGQLVSLYQYSANLGEHALDRIMKDVEETYLGRFSGLQESFPYLG